MRNSCLLTKVAAALAAARRCSFRAKMRQTSRGRQSVITPGLRQSPVQTVTPAVSAFCPQTVLYWLNKIAAAAASVRCEMDSFIFLRILFRLLISEWDIQAVITRWSECWLCGVRDIYLLSYVGVAPSRRIDFWSLPGSNVIYEWFTSWPMQS